MLELQLHPDDAARLLRLPSLKKLRTGRMRSLPQRVVWHDTAEERLGRQGRAAAACRDLWRLELVSPNGTVWPPATPAPVLAQASDAAGLGLANETLVPVAAFDGRERSLALLQDSDALTLTMLDGTLRAVASEQPAALVRLAGPGPAIQTLAVRLAGELRLSVPRQSLAAQGAALARGRPAPPRRLGAPAVDETMSVATALVAIAAHLTDVILYWATLVPGGQTPEPVHQMRVAVRRLRSALSVFAHVADCPALDGARIALRDLATRLAPARDWDVFLSETGADLAALFPGDKRIANLLAAATRRRAAAYAALRQYLPSPAMRQLEIDLACLSALPPWTIQPADAAAAVLGEPCRDFAARILSRRRKRMLQAGAGITELDVAALHELRKNGKKLRYACEFFAALFPGRATRRFLRRMVPLQEVLGHLNDSSVATGLMAQLGGRAERAFALGAVQGFVAGRAGYQRSDIAEAWDRFCDAPVFWH